MLAAFREGWKNPAMSRAERDHRIPLAEDDYDRLPAMAADLVHRQVAVIAATSTPAALAAKTSTRQFPWSSPPAAIPYSSDWSRVGTDLAAMSLVRPNQAAPKRLELALQLVPTATVIGFLINLQNPNAETVTRDLLAAATSLGLQFKELHASTEAEIDQVFTTFRQTRAAVLIIGSDTFFASSAQQ